MSPPCVYERSNRNGKGERTVRRTCEDEEECLEVGRRHDAAWSLASRADTCLDVMNLISGISS